MAKPTYIVPNLEEWQKKFKFFTDIKIRYCETDMSGHVNNTSYVVYFEQARVEYMESIALFHSDFITVTADIWCHYHAEAFFPDVLKIGVRTARIGNSSFDLEYLVTSTNSGKIVATGAGTMVILDKDTRKPAIIPKEIREKIEAFEKES